MMAPELPDNIENISSSQLLSEILHEARRRYDEEGERSRTAESKISTIVTIDALIITLVGGVSTLNSSVDVLSISGTFLALVSTGIGLATLRVREYSVPGLKIDDYYKYTDMDTLSFRDQFLLNYIQEIENAREFNASKFRAFKRCILLTGASLLLVFVRVIVELI